MLKFLSVMWYKQKFQPMNFISSVLGFDSYLLIYSKTLRTRFINLSELFSYPSNQGKLFVNFLGVSRAVSLVFKLFPRL
jgi:hypothetical protein